MGSHQYGRARTERTQQASSHSQPAPGHRPRLPTARALAEPVPSGRAQRATVVIAAIAVGAGLTALLLARGRVVAPRGPACYGVGRSTVSQ
jgi:hypothetical protein